MGHFAAEPKDPRPLVPLIIADGDIATTRLVASELGVVYPSVEVRTTDTLFGTELAGRPIIVSRLCHPSLSWFPGYLAQRGVRYAYFLDDNFWELTRAVDPHLAPYYANPAVRDTLARFVLGADVVIVWSRLLRDYVAQKFPEAKVEFAQTGVDFAALEAARSATGGDTASAIRIGYPTSRRLGVAALLAEVVRGVGQRYAERVQFEFVGWMPEALEGLPNVALTPHIAAYDRYLMHVQSRHWDIGLAPLVGTAFEAFKTDVKFREYASLRMPGVYSRVSPYTESVVDGETGVLVANAASEWIAAIARLIESPLLRRELAEAAFAQVRQDRDLAKTGRRFAALLPQPMVATSAS